MLQLCKINNILLWNENDACSNQKNELYAQNDSNNDNAKSPDTTTVPGTTGTCTCTSTPLYCNASVYVRKTQMSPDDPGNAWMEAADFVYDEYNAFDHTEYHGDDWYHPQTASSLAFLHGY